MRYKVVEANKIPDYEHCEYRSAIIDSTLSSEDAGYVLGLDYGEPEDNSFGRDWNWVAAKLNEQDQRIEELEADIQDAHDDA